MTTSTLSNSMHNGCQLSVNFLLMEVIFNSTFSYISSFLVKVSR